MHHVDEITGEELVDTETITGLEKDLITTKAKDIENYKLSKKPEVEEVEISVNGKDVYYYYKHISKGILIKHIDIITDELLEPEEKIEGVEGDLYSVSQKSFVNYSFVKNSGNITGNMTQDLIEIKFYYIYNSKVKVHHIYGTDGGEDIEYVSGTEGTKYMTHSKNNPVGHDGKLYKLDKSRIPTNSSGVYKKVNSDVYYYYLPRKGNIKIRHVDKATGEDIIPETVIEGFTGDKFETNELDKIEYELVEEPKNKGGVFTDDTEEIVYYYLRKTYVIVNYIDEKKDYTMENMRIDGLETNEYTTNSKDFNYYKLDENKLPKNCKGKFTKEPIIINYYYNQFPFNLGVKQLIDKIVVNDEETNISKTLGKIEINKKLEEYNIKIYYKITVTNDMELEGNTLLKNYVPDGFIAMQEDNPDWEINKNICTRIIKNIKPEEQREYYLILTNTNKKIVGVIPNKVIIENSSNEAGFDETTYEDNKSNTEMIIGIATGYKRNVKLGILIFVGLVIIFLIKNIIKSKYFNK